MHSWPNKISHQHHVPLKSFLKNTYQKFIRNDLKVAIQSNETESESTITQYRDPTTMKIN